MFALKTGEMKIVIGWDGMGRGGGPIRRELGILLRVVKESHRK